MALEKKKREQLKRCRELMNFTQVAVAKALKLESSAMISRWESGESEPSLANAVRLSVLYKTFVNQLFPELFEEAMTELFSDEKEAIRRNSRDGP